MGLRSKLYCNIIARYPPLPDLVGGCGLDLRTDIDIEFLAENGDLPLVKPYFSLLFMSVSFAVGPRFEELDCGPIDTTMEIV